MFRQTSSLRSLGRRRSRGRVLATATAGNGESAGGAIRDHARLTRCLDLELEVLPRIEPAAPAVARIAQECPGPQDPKDIDEDYDLGQPPKCVAIMRPQDQAQ